MTENIPQRKKSKDYNRFCSTIVEEATKARFEVKVLDTIVYGNVGFPFLMLHSKSREAKYNAVITAGFHGDEWWSTDCLLRALGDLDLGLWNFWIFPVANPYGWKYETRLNGEKKESNFRVGKRDTKELAIVFKHLPTRIDLFMDVHGDSDRGEVYAYERKLPNLESLAKLALKDVMSYFDIYQAKTVYKERCRSGVVTSGAEATCEEHLFENYGATYSITLEIPGRISGTGTNRVAGGARLILSTFSNFERAKGEGTKKSPLTEVLDILVPKEFKQDAVKPKEENQPQPNKEKE